MFRRYRRLYTKFYGAPRAVRLGEEVYARVYNLSPDGKPCFDEGPRYCLATELPRQSGRRYDFLAEHMWFQRMNRYIQELPERERNIAQLYFVDGRSQRATATALGVTRWTVRWALYRLYDYFAWTHSNLLRDKGL